MTFTIKEIREQATMLLDVPGEYIAYEHPTKGDMAPCIFYDLKSHDLNGDTYWDAGPEEEIIEWLAVERADKLARTFMDLRSDLTKLSLDEWLIEHNDVLTEAERAIGSEILKHHPQNWT